MTADAAPGYRLMALAATIKIAIFVAAGRGYGYMADELYFLDAADHLAFGYVDFPPAIAWILATVTALLGNDLLVLRGVACLTGIAVTLLAIDIARLLGGRSTAQAITAIVVVFAPAFLSVQSIMTMNVFDQLFFAIGFWLLIRYFEVRDARFMVALGVVSGLALLNKLAILVWFAALGITVLIHARWLLARREVWQAGGLTLAIAVPFLGWQIANDWPFIEFVRAYNSNPPEAMVIDQPLFGLLTTMNPPFLIFWLPGLIYGLIAADPVRRLLGTAAALCLTLFLLAGVKFYFATPLFIIFTALGAIAWERWLARRTRLRVVLLAAMAISGLLSVPIAVPVLPPAALQRVVDFIRDGEQGYPGKEPAPVGRYFPHFAEMHGWPELVTAVTARYEAISPSERASVAVVAAYFGQAGALNQLDHADRLPTVYSGHMNYHRWLPPAALADVLLVGFTPAEIEPLYERVEILGRFNCERCMARENGLYLLRASRPALDLPTISSRIKRLYFF